MTRTRYIAVLVSVLGEGLAECAWAQEGAAPNAPAPAVVSPDTVSPNTVALGAGVHSAEATTATADQQGSGLDALLPLELTAFGDIRYRIVKSEPDDFQIGSVELDASLQLSPHVMVSAALAYKPDADSFGLGAFTVDGSLFGPEPRHLLHSDWITDSGVVFGKFDVPFGIAYLHYASLDNPFVELPSLVNSTHGAWNDLGMQAYAIASKFDLTWYLVNGAVLDPDSSVEHAPIFATGARLGVKPLPELACGVSVAEVPAKAYTGLFGADLSATSGPFEVQNEFIWREFAHGPVVHGLYTTVLARHQDFFGGARWEGVLSDGRAIERGLGLTLGATVFERAEVRVAHVHSMLNEGHTTFLQLAGGSIWQPTGLRR